MHRLKKYKRGICTIDIYRCTVLTRNDDMCTYYMYIYMYKYIDTYGCDSVGLKSCGLALRQPFPIESLPGLESHYIPIASCLICTNLIQYVAPSDNHPAHTQFYLFILHNEIYLYYLHISIFFY